MQKIKYFIIVVFVLLLSKVKSQDHGFFNQVWLEEGLSQSSIVSIIQDKQGFMWFATQDGLNRYDGRNIDHFNFKPFDKQSISGDDIYSICLDANTLFVINDKGLDKIDLRNLKINNIKRKAEKESKLIFFKSWFFNNTLFLLDRDGLLKAKTQKNNELSYEYCLFEDSLQSKVKIVINSICTDNYGNVFAATNKGIYAQYDGQKTFKNIFSVLPANIFKNEEEAFYSTISWKNDKLYFTNASNLFSLNLLTKKLSTISLKQFTAPSSILVDKQNKIWIGTSGKGLLVIREKMSDSLEIEKHFTKSNNSRFTLQSNEITSLYQNPNSNEDVIWIGTRDAGAFNFSYSKNSFSMPTSFVNTSDQNFFAIVKDNNNIIWAGYNAGILKIDESKKTHQIIDFSSFYPKSNRPVTAMCSDGEDNIWTAFGNSIYLIDKVKSTLILKINQMVPQISNQSFKMVVLNKEELLVCTARGIVIYNKQKNTTTLINSILVNNQNISLENTESFLLDSKGNWWVGSAKGLYCIKTDKNNFVLKHNNNDSNSIISNRIMDIKETADGIIIATTKGLSLIKNYGQQIKNIYSAKGLSNNFIYGLLEDKTGRFWMSTNFGISVFNPKNLEFKSYTASDGICINEFNQGGFYKTNQGELIFGGLGGLVSVYPENQIINKNVADIILRSVRIENYTDSIELNNLLDLKHSQNDIFLEFSIPDYSGEKNMNLYYRFKNKDTNWIKVNPSQLFSLSFINLAPGNYNFEAAAINNEGARSKPFSIVFKINNPFWSTWWFYLILILITVFLSWVIYRSRLKRKINYIQQIEKIRKDEAEKVRKAAALDLHDEFGNGLTRISMLIEMIKIHVMNENTDAHKLLEMISQNSNRLYHGTKDFIWSINPGKDNMYEIAIRIKDYADELFYGTKTTFELIGLKEELKQIRQSPTAGRNITMIFKESLSNVLKHAKADLVKLTIKHNAEHIFVILEDNGIGFEMKDYKNSFGLTNIQQRASRLDSEIEISSNSKEGTKIVLVINLKNQQNDNNNP